MATMKWVRRADMVEALALDLGRLYKFADMYREDHFLFLFLFFGLIFQDHI